MTKGLTVIARSRGQVRAQIALCAAAIAALAGAFQMACREDDGCGDEQDPPVGLFEDTPRPVLCASDSLIITPGVAKLRSAGDRANADVSGETSFEGGAPAEEPSGDDGGSADAGTQGGTVASDGTSIQVAIVGRRASGQPHERAHVDVTVGPCELLSTTGLVTIAPSVDSRIAGGCRRVSDVFLECTLDETGTASFVVSAKPNSRGIERICVKSGLRKQDHATITVGDVTSIDGVALQDVGKAVVVGLPAAMTCTSPTPSSVTCATPTARRVQLVSLGTVVVNADDGGRSFDAGPVAPAGPVEVIAATLAQAGGPNTWLSRTASCEGQQPSLSVRFDGRSELADPFFYCSDGAAGEASLVVSFPTRITRTGRESFPIRFAGVPAIVEPRSVDAGPDADLELIARDCRGASLAGATINLGTGGSLVTNDAGAVVTNTVDGGVTVFVANPELIAPPSTCNERIGGGQ